MNPEQPNLHNDEALNAHLMQEDVDNAMTEQGRIYKVSEEGDILPPDPTPEETQH